jgi:glycosyltransferase involved in cell wall biosynthesis
MSVFVQIAAYREEELLPTIQDCIANAKWPRALRFGICWQTDEKDESLKSFADDRRFRVDRVPWQDSQGLCWARSRIQKLYQGEEFTLQLDAHHRFAPDWDERLLKMMELTGSPKPIVGSYAGIYDPKDNYKKGDEPFAMVADKFTQGGTILFRPHGIKGWRDMTHPVRARFVSGHFFATIGKHCEEYRYDPNLYFAGDEISLAIRSFTLGYDLFHPHRTVVWHEYTRRGRTKHWDDHTSKNVAVAWHQRDTISKARLRKLLREEDNDSDITGFDLGTVRSHRDYEEYAGIDFAGRRLHPDTRAGLEPPTALIEPQEIGDPFLYTEHCRSRAHCRACRNDAAWRQTLVTAGIAKDRDFACIWGQDPPSAAEGCGTRLMRILSHLGFTEGPGCGCRSTAAKMNMHGPQWSREHMDDILKVMEGAAAKKQYNPLGLPFVRGMAKRLVLHCCRN